MRKMSIIVAIAVLLTLPVDAAGKGKPPKAPAMGKTCAELVANGGDWDLGHPQGDGSYVAVISNDPGHGGVCIDVAAAAGGDWVIEWDIEMPQGFIDGLFLLIKDSHPGDQCWSEEILEPAEAGTTTATNIPAAATNACPGGWDDPSPDLAFIAMRNIKGPNIKAAKRNGFTITFTVTPPHAA